MTDTKILHTTFSKAQQQQRAAQLAQIKEEVQAQAKLSGRDKRGLGINQVLLVGRLAADPDSVETRTTTKTTVRIVTNDRSEPEFHVCVLWGAQAQAAAIFLKKGRMVMVQGRIHHNEWVAADGTKHRSDEVQAHNIQFLDRPVVAEEAA
jgi:single stranded DNA-binding protein